MGARFLLLFSAFSPLPLLLAVRIEDWRWTAGLVLLFAVAAAALPLTIWLGHRRNQPTRGAIVSQGSAEHEIAGYLTAYILPFAFLPAPGLRDALALMLFGGLLFAVYLGTDRVAVNPLLIVFRLKLLHIDVGNGPELAISRLRPDIGDDVHLTRLLRGVYHLTAAPVRT